ncbi:ATP-binding cassette domain-containing protein [Microbacterium sp. zg.B48]|uniref:ATP-binding cassette domain-containing protein n=1 Tax=unclassified Microbacterium TaxID=2609290 RepID=UPI00214D0783|nr:MULTISPECIES: ATP-binding cassette domain-containing protein [unclassified Microbacterium]MCR2765188.1 ATP-binding cassette domain-containing protein [Microbacterium sp. zg.B48]MCR2809560.1 ATP-binding cassette domain-containing protein [Microbacterium sp. zg.B185]WIM20692.1 ATP-binding cassette domain-containing protein [Microbacterium sp. zg-B185]
MPRPRDADVAIRTNDLSIARAARGGPDLRVIDGVSFEVAHGATLAVMGPTGSGKSSLLAVLAGADEPGLGVVGGSAHVEGIAVRRPGRAHRTLTYLTGYLPQTAGARLPARMTVAEVIGEPITSRDRRVNQRALAVRVATLLDELMLPLGAAAKYPYELSAGMRQRVVFARALVLQPRTLIADEPFSNMDVEVRRAARDAILRRRQAYGMSAIIVTNEADVARELAAEVLVLRGGHAIAYGRGADDLLWTPSGGADRRLVVS